MLLSICDADQKTPLDIAPLGIEEPECNRVEALAVPKLDR